MKKFGPLLGGYKKILMVAIFLVLVCSANALAGTYFIYDSWGGTWSDVDKTGNDDTDLVSIHGVTSAAQNIEFTVRI